MGQRRDATAAVVGPERAGGQQGIYEQSGGFTSRIADQATANGSGMLFQSFNQLTAVSGSTVVFSGTTSSGLGIYISTGGTPTLVVSTQTSIPGGSGVFGSFNGFSISGSSVALNGQNSANTRHGLSWLIEIR